MNMALSSGLSRSDLSRLQRFRRFLSHLKFSLGFFFIEGRNHVRLLLLEFKFFTAAYHMARSVRVAWCNQMSFLGFQWCNFFARFSLSSSLREAKISRTVCRRSLKALSSSLFNICQRFISTTSFSWITKWRWPLPEIELTRRFIVPSPKLCVAHGVHSVLKLTKRMASRWRIEVLSWVLGCISCLPLLPSGNMMSMPRISRWISPSFTVVICTLSIWPSSLWMLWIGILVSISSTVVVISSSLFLLVINWHQWTWNPSIDFWLSSFLSGFLWLHHSFSWLWFSFFSLFYSFCHSSFLGLFLNRLDYLRLFQILLHKWLNWRVIWPLLSQNLYKCWIRCMRRWWLKDWRQFVRRHRLRSWPESSWHRLNRLLILDWLGSWRLWFNRLLLLWLTKCWSKDWFRSCLLLGWYWLLRCRRILLFVDWFRLVDWPWNRTWSGFCLVFSVWVNLFSWVNWLFWCTFELRYPYRSISGASKELLLLIRESTVDWFHRLRLLFLLWLFKLSLRRGFEFFCN